MNLIKLALSNRFIVGIVLIAGVVSIGWLIWFVGATRYQDEIDRWMDVGRKAGYEIAYDRREQFGFPRHTVLRFVNLRWKNTDGVTFKAGDLDISADVWPTKNFTAKFKGKIELELPADDDHSLVLGGENGQAMVTLADDGLWEDCHLTMNAARVGRVPDYVFLADTIKLSAKRPAVQPMTAKEAGLTLSGEAEDVSLPDSFPESFGNKMPQLAVDMRVMGPVPDFRKKNSVTTWNKINGVVDFDRLDMELGPLLLTSKGTMGFDDDLQPEGAFAGVVAHQDKVLQTLMQAGFIPAKQENMLSSAMRLFAKPASVKGEDGVEVPVAVQLGGLFLGPVKIFAFPQIGWE